MSDEVDRPQDDSLSIDTEYMPHNRDNYDFSENILEQVPTYYQQNGEVSKILADVQNNDVTGKLPRYLIGGPTGCGKSSAAKSVAHELGVPYFEIQCKYSMNELDLLGSPRLVGGRSYWSDGPLTKALLASQEGRVVVLLDEVNRARAQSKSVLLPALDSRATVTIEARGGEVISGNAENMIVIGTVNEGSEYITESMDKAEIRRFNTRFNLSYLGENRPDAEIRLLVDETTIPGAVALQMVGVANDLRRQAADDESPIKHGLPTANLLSWARTAISYSNSMGTSDPVMEAARDTVINAFYSDNPGASTRIEKMIETNLSGAPVEESDELYVWWSQDGDTLDGDRTEELAPQYDYESIVNAGLPDSVASPLQQNDAITTQTLLDANVEERAIRHLVKDL